MVNVTTNIKEFFHPVLNGLSGICTRNFLESMSDTMRYYSKNSAQNASIFLLFSYGAVAHGVSNFQNVLCLLYCVPLYVCRLCINYQDLSTNLLGVASLRILLLTFISCFVIDFLSIRKVIVFSAIATDDRHPLRSRSIHQNAANCMTIRFCYIALPRGVRKTYCARSRNDVRRLTSRSNGMPSKKIMESLRTFVFVETVLRRGRMFQGSDEV